MASSSVSVSYCGVEANMVRCAVAEGLLTVHNTQTQTSAGERITPSVSSCLSSEEPVFNLYLSRQVDYKHS